MKRIISIVMIMGCVCFTGCAEHNCPHIIEYGKSGLADDNTSIELPQAEHGLQGYEINETDTGIDVVLHYKKKEKAE